MSPKPARLIANGLGRETADQVGFDVQRMVFDVDRRRDGHNGHLVFRAASHLAGSALTPEIGVIQLDGDVQEMGAVLPGLGAGDAPMEQP